MDVPDPPHTYQWNEGEQAIAMPGCKVAAAALVAETLPFVITDGHLITGQELASSGAGRRPCPSYEVAPEYWGITDGAK